LDVEKHIWSMVMEVVREVMGNDEEDRKSGVSIVPKVAAFSYCPKCDRLTTSLSFLMTDMDAIRLLFPIFVASGLEVTSKCKECGRNTIPIGYAYFSEAWMLMPRNEEEQKEAELYWRVVGSIENHPRKREIYLASVVTVLGKKKVIVKEIVRRPSGVAFRKVKMPVHDFTGRFVLPLPKIDIKKAVKKLKK